jgi:inorganic pyrophosphatase
MLHPWHDLPPGPSPPERLTVVVEIPRGSRNKYELDKSSGSFKLDRVLYSAVHYPGDYGFVPRTYAEDDDPLDALVILTAPTFTGCTITVRPIGIFLMRDRGELDEKVLCVPERDPLYAGYRDLADVPDHLLKEIEHFFSIYKDLEGIRISSLGWRDLASAREVIAAAIARYGSEEERLRRAPLTP